MSAVQRYARAQAETASPEGLLVLLLQRALQHMRVAAAAIEEGRPDDANVPLAKANEIVVELHATLDTRRAPELAARLGEVYRFVCQRLLDANIAKDASRVHEAERAFAPVVEAFAEAVRRVGGQP
jgi:flagellar protein FliS